MNLIEKMMTDAIILDNIINIINKILDDDLVFYTYDTEKMENCLFLE